MRAAVVVFVVVIFGLLSVMEAVPAPQFYGGFPSYGNYGGYGGYPSYGFGGGYPGYGFNRFGGGAFSSASASSSAGSFGGNGFYG